MPYMVRLSILLKRGLKKYVKNSAHNKSLSFMFWNTLDTINRWITLPSAVAYALARYYNRRSLQEFREKYVNSAREVRIPPINDEDYEFQWGKIDYKGKVVLDIGADVGSTADFFLRKGAKEVIAVEGSKVFFERLKANASTLDGIIPIFIFIDRPSQVENLILKWGPDVVKMDIEGDEMNMFQMRDEVFRKVPKYIIEVHSDDLFNMMLEKCARNNYEVMGVNTWVPPLRIVYARKKEVLSH